MNDFILGVLSSLVATLLIYLFRYQLGYIINLIFFKVYPNISGEYKVYIYEWNNDSIEENNENNIESDYPNDEQFVLPTTQSSNEDILNYLRKTDCEPFVKATINQFAYKIRGEITTVNKGQVIDIEKFKGRITPSRVVLLNTETVTPDHHNFGTYLLRLTPANNVIKGAKNYLCIECGDVGTSYVLFEKIK
ncbi:MAG: hypothetical protein ACOZCO_00770 [Bacteroidota bacterium]